MSTLPSLYGIGLNKYWGLSDWRTRGDGYDEKPMSGEDIEFSGRLAEMPQLEFFIKGYRWQQEKTAVLNPDGDDIWGYRFTSEYTPLRAVTFSGSATKDNAMENFQGELTLRFNYNFGSDTGDLWLKEDINLETVTDKRFDKVRRENIIKVQKRVSESNAATAVPTSSIMGLAACPTGDLSAAANAGCARLFGADPNDINDIAVYAGDVPGTGTDFFVRRCDIGQDYDPVDNRCEDGGGDPNTRTALRWKNVTTDSATPFVGTGALWTTPGAVDGVSNTADLVTDGSGTHAAAETCNALPGGGWYLPAVSELDVAYANLA